MGRLENDRYFHLPSEKLHDQLENYSIFGQNIPF